MKIRTYQGKDAYAIPNLWNRALTCDPISRELFIRKLLLDPNFSDKGFFIAEDDATDKVIGFANAVFRRVPVGVGGGLDENVGFLSTFAVDPDFSAEKVGGELLNAAESYFKLNGKSKITTAYSPLYFTQGIEENTNKDYIDLFTSHGYSFQKSIAMDLDLTSYHKSEKVEEKRKRLVSEGFYIGKLKDEYIISFLNPNAPFNSIGWSAEYRMRLLAGLDFDSIFIAAKDKKVVGACVFGDPNSSPERFGPFGVNSDLQGKGIGRVLLSDCLFEMKKRNLHCAWMQWPSNTGAAGKLYESVGFRVTKSYVTFSKTI